MSHSVQTVTGSGNGLTCATVTIVNYAVGGEAFSLADFPGAITINGVVMGNVPASKNSLGVALFPILDAGKVRLFQFVSGSPVEIGATTALNAQIAVIIF